MSDFDKEAERERLREKYGDEAEEREATQHMSELLLKGATMTNKHCGRCGDPIFRHDGQEFCPSCNMGGQQSAADAEAANAGEASGTPEQTPADANAQASGATTNEIDDASTATADPEATTTAAPSNQVEAAGSGPRTSPTEANPDARRNATSRDGETTTSQSNVGGDEPIPVDADAIAQVEATVERFAAAAANTDDPERAQECLEVVRHAAETLRVLRANQR